ncbi:hypothetical protein ACSHLS_002106, partial [Escherichia coli]
IRLNQWKKISNYFPYQAWRRNHKFSNYHGKDATYQQCNYHLILLTSSTPRRTSFYGAPDKYE